MRTRKGPQGRLAVGWPASCASSQAAEPGMRIAEFYTNKAVFFKHCDGNLEIDFLPERIIVLFRMGKAKSWRSACRKARARHM